MFSLLSKLNKHLGYLAISVLILAISVSSAKAIELKSIEDYLNSVHSLEAKFNQTNYDGSESSGLIWLEKPGKLRLEYEQPSSLLVISSSGFTAVIDRLSNTLPQRYFTKNIPLNFLVEKNVNFLEEENSFALSESEDTIKLKIFIDNSESKLIINFTTNPLTISGWTIQTATGEIITLNLFDTKFNVEITEDWIFGIGGEIQKHMGKISE